MIRVMPYQNAGFLLFCLIRDGNTLRWSVPSVLVPGLGDFYIDGPTATFPTLDLAESARNQLCAGAP